MATKVGDHRPKLAVVAAAARAEAPKSFIPSGKKTLSKIQESRLWDLYEGLGPVHAAVQFRRQSVLRAKFYPGRVTDPDVDPDPVTDGPVRRQFDRLDGGRGRVAIAVADASVQWDVVGGCYLTWRSIDELLRVYANGVIEPGPNGTWLRKSGREIVETFGFDDLVVRLWRASPRDPEIADSHLRPIAEQADELLALGRMIRATVLSKTNAGIAYIPDELLGPEPDPDPMTNERPEPKLIKDIREHWRRPIEDPGSMSAVAPLLVNGPAAFAENLRRIDFSRSVTKEEAALRQELLQWIAIGLDLPPETVTGSTGLNDWSKLMVDMDAYKQHVDPTVLEILDGINREVWWPMLKATGIRDFEEFVIWRDLSQLIASPSAFNDSLLAFDRAIVTAEAVRRRGGFSDADAPEEDAAQEAIGDAQDPNNRPDQAPAPEGPQPGPDKPSGPGEPPAERTPASAAVLDAVASIDRIAALVAGRKRKRGKRLYQIDQGTLGRVMGMARAEHKRALDRAGARSRNKIKRDKDALAATKGSPNSHVTLRLGPLYLQSLQLTENELVTREDFDGFRDDVARLFRRAVDASATEIEFLTDQSVPRNPEEEDRAIADAAERVTAEVLHATRRDLFTPELEPDPGETGEVTEGPIDSQAVMDAMSVAGGSIRAVTAASAALALGTTYDYGIGNGSRARGWHEGNGFVVSGMIWVYGDPSSRKANYIPHLELDGVDFMSWQDVLIHGNFPGDHRGCQCSYEKLLVHQQAADPAGSTATLTERAPVTTDAEFLRATEGLIAAANPEDRPALKQARNELAAAIDSLPASRREAVRSGFVAAIEATPNFTVFRGEWRPGSQMFPYGSYSHAGIAPGMYGDVRVPEFTLAMNRLTQATSTFLEDNHRQPARGEITGDVYTEPASPRHVAAVMAHELTHATEYWWWNGKKTEIEEGDESPISQWNNAHGKHLLYQAQQASIKDDNQRWFAYGVSDDAESASEAMRMYLFGIPQWTEAGKTGLTAAQWRKRFPEVASLVEDVLIPNVGLVGGPGYLGDES